MTTGQINPLEYISLKPDENTRSVSEICEAVRVEGYEAITHGEMDLYISYREKIAVEENELRLRKLANDKQMEHLQSALDEMKANRDARRKEEENGKA